MIVSALLAPMHSQEFNGRLTARSTSAAIWLGCVLGLFCTLDERVGVWVAGNRDLDGKHILVSTRLCTFNATPLAFARFKLSWPRQLP
jgi:hypothetical protein